MKSRVGLRKISPETVKISRNIDPINCRGSSQVTTSQWNSDQNPQWKILALPAIPSFSPIHGVPAFVLYSAHTVHIAKYTVQCHAVFLRDKLVGDELILLLHTHFP